MNSVEIAKFVIFGVGLIYLHQGVINFLLVKNHDTDSESSNYNYTLLSISSSIYCFLLLIKCYIKEAQYAPYLLSLIVISSSFMYLYYFRSLWNHSAYSTKVRRIIHTLQITLVILPIVGLIQTILKISYPRPFYKFVTAPSKNVFTQEFLHGLYYDSTSWSIWVVVFSTLLSIIVLIGLLVPFIKKSPIKKDYFLLTGYIMSLMAIISGSLTSLDIEWAIPGVFMSNAPEILRITYLAQIKKVKKIKELSLKVQNGLINHNIKLQDQIDKNRQLMDILIIEKEKALESDRVKSEFISSINHEIKTPLSCTLAATELIEKNFQECSSRQYLGIIKNNLKFLNSFMNNMLDISHISSGILNFKFQFINLHEVFTKTIASLVVSEFFRIVDDSNKLLRCFLSIKSHFFMQVV